MKRKQYSVEQTYDRWTKEYGGLKVAQKQPKRGRLWLNDGSWVRLRPTHRRHVWSYDFMADRTHDGRPIKILTVIDEFSRESLSIMAERRVNSDDVLHCLIPMCFRINEIQVSRPVA
jgi:putative transposase